MIQFCVWWLGMVVFGFNVYQKPIEECIDYAHEHDIHHLELDLNAKHSQLHTFTPERIETIKQEAAKTSIKLGLHTPVDFNLAGNLFLRRPYIKTLKKCLTLAQQINACYLTCHIGHFHDAKPWPWQRRKMLQRVVNSIQSVIERDDNEVVISLENAVSTNRESEVHHLGDCIEDFEFLFSKLPSDRVGMCLDVGHANMNCGPLTYLEYLGDRIRHVHFHDNHGINDEHLCVGEGTVPWKELALKLKQKHKSILCVSECFNQPPHVSISRFQEFFS